MASKIMQAGVFPKFEGEEYEKFIELAEKLRSDYDFGHTLDAKLLPKGDSSVTGPIIRLFKPFDELFVDSKVINYKMNLLFLQFILYFVALHRENCMNRDDYIFLPRIST